MALHAELTPLATSLSSSSDPSEEKKLYSIATLYGFIPVKDPESTKDSVLDKALSLDLIGIMIIATEGVNGTMAGSREDLETFVSFLEETMDGLSLKPLYTESYKKPFKKCRIVVKPEIVTFQGDSPLTVDRSYRSHVAPTEWNDLISAEDTVVIDVRNEFEVDLGSFEGADNPKTFNFTDFKEYVATHQENLKQANKVAMFCTGGIRCEKASVYLEQQGIEHVYQLEGGILNYLRQIPPEQSLWHGECFVFDQRVTLTHDLKQGHYHLERGQALPVKNADS